MNSVACIEQLEMCAEWQQQTILPWLEDTEIESRPPSPPEMSGAINSRGVNEDSVSTLALPPPSSTTTTSSSAIVSNRRGSLALSLHSNLSGFAAPAGPSNDVSAFHVVGSARRRLSNVSDVVSRKISHTIGWRTLSASIDQTVSQGSSLCAQYIRQRLKRSGIFQRKLGGLRRMRSATLLPGGAVVSDVLPELVAVGAELEKTHAALYVRVGRQIGRGNFAGEQTAGEAMADVAREVIRAGEMTWSKVVALYAVAGGIAVDCVRQGKPEYLPSIQRGMTDVLEEDLAAWIQANGGWTALAARYRPAPKPTAWQTHRLTIVFFLTAAFLIGVLSIILRLLIF